jgi:hypothetical protein
MRESGNKVSGSRTSHSILIAFSLLAGLALIASLALNPADAAARKHKHPAVTLKVATKNQAALLKTGKLRVRLTATFRTRVRLSAYKSKSRHLFRKKVVVFKRKSKQTRTISLALTPRGRKKLARCGVQKVSVLATFTRKLRRRGKLVRRKATVKRHKRLARDRSRCGHKPPPLPNPKTTPGCDPTDSANCMLPYPNDYFTRPDPSTPTGLRLDFKSGHMPTGKSGQSIFTDAYNLNDGFSPNNIMVARVPGLDTPEAFRANDLVSQLNIGAYAASDQRVVLLDARTGQRVPIWAEIDMIPGTPNPHNNDAVQGTTADRTLLIHPAVSLEYGHRYIVALRDLTTAAGTTIEPNEVFREYRDGIRTSNRQVEDHRPHMNQLFATLGEAGIARDDLYLAWDFTVASKENLTGPAVAMRNDAFAQLGDTDLADGKVQGHSPDIQITAETELATCPDDAPCENGESRYAFKTVQGTITVPCYMNAPGPDYSVSEADIPCASGSRLNYAPGTNRPVQAVDSHGDPVTWQAPFTCTIPRAGANTPLEKTSGNKAIVFGHGLMQSNLTTIRLAQFPGAMSGVTCGTDWTGLSADDLVKFLALMIGKGDLSLFPALPDRTVQGYVNALYLARALAASDGFAAEPEFQDSEGHPIFEVDQDDTARDLVYYGISLGGINGGAATALAPDWKRASLAVPGMGFTTLLTRSSQFNRFLPPIYAAYPDPLQRSVGISILQILWDRGEPSAYSRSIVDGLGTPSHRIVMQESFGDHQVTNIQTETLARTLGVTLRVPGTGPAPDSPITPGRIADLGTIADPEGNYLFTPMDELDPYWGIPTGTSAEFNQPGGIDNPNGAFLVTDTGNVRPGAAEGHPDTFLGTTAEPDWNIAPVEWTGSTANDGLDPHAPGATSSATQMYIWPFLTDGGIFDPCGNGLDPLEAAIPPYTTPYSSGDPIPCPAASTDFNGNGQ